MYTYDAKINDAIVIDIFNRLIRYFSLIKSILGSDQSEVTIKSNMDTVSLGNYHARSQIQIS